MIAGYNDENEGRIKKLGKAGNAGPGHDLMNNKFREEEKEEKGEEEEQKVPPL